MERLKCKEGPTHVLKANMHRLFYRHKTNVKNVQHFHSQTNEGKSMKKKCTHVDNMFRWGTKISAIECIN